MKAWSQRLFAVGLALAPVTVEPQTPESHAPDVDSLVARARLATERFKDISVAIAESYVKVGPDFPAMGEHWVNGELIMRAELDAARPAILTYATIDGKPTLTGVVYALALRPGERPPLLPPGAQWHDHVGSVDEESLLFGHDRESGSDSLRLAVMHAWLWVENPAGMFATDNWNLPLARVGLKAREITPAAARAVSVLAGASAYYQRLFASVGQLEEAEVAAVSDLLERYRDSLSAWWSTRAPSETLSPVDVATLDRDWRQLESDIARSVRRTSARRLTRVFAHH